MLKSFRISKICFSFSASPSLISFPLSLPLSLSLSLSPVRLPPPYKSPILQYCSQNILHFRTSCQCTHPCCRMQQSFISPEDLKVIIRLNVKPSCYFRPKRFVRPEAPPLLWRQANDRHLLSLSHELKTYCTSILGRLRVQYVFDSIKTLAIFLLAVDSKRVVREPLAGISSSVLS